ncbi:MAG TPA: phosphohistidine phosphatase SixA [Candidatus Paceibacterota bacterium]|nr:phosphohistidine phosphatase SixA [Verrucomicrobiota bacterium]HOX04512.1 phosphohistidine phosphatase SixA [Verrucomicrobiota bacterium]HRZ47479.1 phosphohistidine phosphatase SixA [Candidatus Paceibacterota bacterium]
MKIYLLRHGRAVERDAAGWDRDCDRPLTSEGEKQMVRIARGMRQLNLEFDHALSSPYARAWRTAEIAAKELGLGARLRASRSLAPGGDPAALVRQLRRLPQPAQRVLLVGHEPYLSRLAGLWIGGSDGLRIELKKGGLIRLEMDDMRLGQCATLEWLLSPRHLMDLSSCGF